MNKQQEQIIRGGEGTHQCLDDNTSSNRKAETLSLTSGELFARLLHKMSQREITTGPTARKLAVVLKIRSIFYWGNRVVEWIKHLTWKTRLQIPIHHGNSLFSGNGKVLHECLPCLEIPTKVTLG